MVESDDFSIIKKVLQGDKGEFAKIIGQYQQTIYRLVLRMVGNEEEAKDLTQNIFIKVYLNLEKYDPNHKFFSWLYKIAIHETLNFLKSERSVLSIDQVSEAEIKGRGKGKESLEQQVEVRKAVLQLRPKYRLLIVLKYYNGLSYEQIAMVTRLPEKKVRSRLYDARQMLRGLIIEIQNRNDS
jgi:RNA polymerase sigma-70 factor (ECF subfamily)